MRRFVVSAFLSVLLVVLAVSCNMTGTRVSERQNLTINPKIVDISTASLVPTSPTPSKLRFELWREGKEEVTKTLDYAGQGSSYVIEDVLVGTYSVYVYGLDADDKEIMKGGPVSFTVKPNSSNSCKVDLDFLSEKYGSVAVKITWDSSELSDSPISEAIESGRIGFLGFFGSGEYKDKTLKGDTVDESSAYNLIHWVENAAADEFLYKESSVPSTGSAGADAYFIIYTYDEDNNVIALAKTFYTTLIVYDNLESIPDANEVYNFHIDSSTIEGYISNVSASTVTAEPDPSSPVDTLIVSWDNPVFSSDIYPITVNVWLTDKSNRIMGSKQSFVYANKDAASDRGSAKFSQLSSSEKYDVWFSVEGAIGYSKEEIKLENVNPKISVQSIAFPKGFASAYTAGQRIQIEPVFTPTEATVKDFTVKEKANSDDISFDGANVTFDHAGSYTLVITSMDNSEASAEHPVTVRLGKPSSVSAEAENDGIVVSWTPVADADGYAITRTSEDGSSVDFMPGAVSEYKDMAVLSGEKYTYSVKAIKNNDNEGLYTGDAEISTEVSTPEAGIQVSIPGIVTADFSSVLDALVNEYMDITDPERDSISVGFTGEVTDSNGNKAENYTWKLNGNLLKSGDFSEAGTLTLSYEEYEAAFHLGSDDNVNYLTVEVRLAGQTPRTATVAFHVLKGNPGTIIGITDADDDGRVVYNSVDNRTEKLTLNLSGNTIEPMISWSVAYDDKDIVSIDGNGNVKSLKMGSAIINATVLATGESASFEVISYVPVASIEIIDNGSKDLIFPSNSVDILEESIYKRQLTLNVTAVNGEIVPSDYVGKYSSAINWSSNDSEAVSVLAGYIEAKGKPVDAVMISAVSADDSDIYDRMEYAAIELDITVDSTRTYGKETDIVGSWITSPTARKLSLWSANDYLSAENFSSKGFSGRWAMTENWEAGTEPEERTEVKDSSEIYVRLTDCTDFTANAYRRSISNEPIICNVISWNGNPVVTVHFKAGYKIK